MDMRNISIIKKIKFFLFYKKTIKSIEAELETLFNVRIDEADRMYTVLYLNKENKPFENYGIEELKISNQNYDLLPSYIEEKQLEILYQKSMKEFSNNFSEYLNTKGLSELYNFYQIEKLNKYNYLVVLGFSMFKSDFFYRLLYKSIRITIGTIIGVALFLYFSKYLVNIANF